MSTPGITVNRAPVLTLWAAVVAERLGYDPDAALTLGKAVEGFTAQGKGRMLGIYGSPSKGGADGPPARKSGLGEDCFIELCGRPIPARHTPAGLRACVRAEIIEPETVKTYLAKAFGERLSEVRSAMEMLARSMEAPDLATRALGLYESFRPAVSRGQAGWGQKGTLDLSRIAALAGPPRKPKR
jgi:hypothetical protein